MIFMHEITEMAPKNDPCTTQALSLATTHWIECAGESVCVFCSQFLFLYMRYSERNDVCWFDNTTMNLLVHRAYPYIEVLNWEIEIQSQVLNMSELLWFVALVNNTHTNHIRYAWFGFCFYLVMSLLSAAECSLIISNFIRVFVLCPLLICFMAFMGL